VVTACLGTNESDGHYLNGQSTRGEWAQLMTINRTRVYSMVRVFPCQWDKALDRECTPPNKILGVITPGNDLICMVHFGRHVEVL